MKNIIKTIVFALLIAVGSAHTGESNTQPASQSNGWWGSFGWSSLTSGVASLFSAPYIANNLSSLATNAATGGASYAGSLVTGTASYLKPVASTLATNPAAQKVAVGLTAVATPYITTWILMYRAHAKFDDAIGLIQPPIDIKTINTAAHSIDNDTKEIFEKIKEALPNNKIDPAFKENVVQSFMPWWNATAELNDKITKNTKILRDELNKNKSTNQYIKTITERTKTIEDANSEFDNAINNMAVTSTQPYSDIRASTGIITLSSSNRTRQSALNTLIFNTIPALERELVEGPNKDIVAKILTLVRQKYNIPSNTRTGIPLTRYSDDLTWYINKLWWLQVFFLGTGKRAEIQTLIENLKTIRGIIAGTKDFADEQRNSK